jgi:hypothetical protein
MLSRLSTADVMLFLIEKVLPMFEASDNDVQRQGASEAIASILYTYISPASLAEWLRLLTLNHLSHISVGINL